MPKGDKYINLKRFLEKTNESILKLTFAQIEQIIGFESPMSATKYAEAWWSNNVDHSQAIAWLEAGYETDYVADTYRDKHIIFVKKDQLRI